MMEILTTWGVPAAITGLLVYFLKRYIDKKDKEREQREKEARRKQEELEKKREEREERVERLMLLIMKTGRATNVLATATAKAVQRIPDAHCNGDMTEALKSAAAIQNEEKDLLVDEGIKHIFGD